MASSILYQVVCQLNSIKAFSNDFHFSHFEMSRLSLSRPGMSIGILKAEVADLKFQNFHSKELERCLAFDALALLGGNEYLVQVEYFCTTQEFEEQETFEKVQNGNEYLVLVDPHCFCTTQEFDEQETFEKMQNGNEYLF